MDTSLEGVLARIPGLAGYLGQTQFNQNQSLGGINQAGGLLSLRNAIDSQREQQQIRGILASNPDMQAAIAELPKAGVEGVNAAARLQALETARRNYELTSQLGDLNQLNPDQLDRLGGRLAIQGHPGAATVMAIADRRRAQQSGAQALDAMRSQGSVGPVGPQIPQAGAVPQFLMNDETFGPSAQALMQRINQGAFQTPKDAEAAIDRLSTAYNASQTAKALQAEKNKATQPDPQAIESNAKAISEYKLPPINAYAMRTPAGQETMKRVMEMNPNYDAKNYVTAQRTRNAFAVGVEGRTVRSFNVAIDHLDTLNDAADALQNNDIKRFNQLKQRIAEETGSPVPTNFDAVKSIVAKELVKSVVGNAQGGGVTERQELSTELSRANSPEQLKGMIGRYQTLMAGQLKGLKQQYEAGFGGSDFDKFMLPRSKEVFSRMQQSGEKPTYIEIRVTPSGKRLGKKADGTIEEVK